MQERDGRALRAIGPTGTWPLDEPGGRLPVPSPDAVTDATGPPRVEESWPPVALRRWVGVVLAVGLVGPLVALGMLMAARGPLGTPMFWLVLVLNVAMLAAGTLSVRRGRRAFHYALGDLAVLISLAVTSPSAALLAAALPRGAGLIRDCAVHPGERLRLTFNFGSGMLAATLTVLVVAGVHTLPWGYPVASLAAGIAAEYALWRCYRLTYGLRLSGHVTATGALRIGIPVLVALAVGLFLLLPIDDYVVVAVPLAAAVVWKLAYELADLRTERAAWDNLDEHNARLLGERNELEIARRATANAVRIFRVTECRLMVHPTSARPDAAGHLFRARRDGGGVEVTQVPADHRPESPERTPYVTATEAVGVLEAAGRELGRCELLFQSPQRHRRQLARVFSQFLSSTASTLMLARQHESMRSYAESKAREAERDQLTQLGNRTRLYRGGVRALRRASTRGRHASLIMFDLDGFKRINDTLGHAVGDEVLKVVANRMRALVGPSDIAARVGGDEFVVLAADLAGPEEAMRYAESIAAMVSRTVPVEDIQLAVEASLGIAHVQKGIGVSELLKRADIALYEAKVNKSNRPEVFDPRMAQHTPEQLLLMVDLRAALARAEADRASADSGADARRHPAELVLHYQPQVDLRSGAVVGAEALVRWQHPIHGLLQPDTFVPLAEQSGMITAFTQHVLEQALQDYLELRDRLRAHGEGFTVSVNLSVRNLLDLSLPGQLEGQLAAHGVSPDQLVIEVTESANVQDWTSAERVMGALADLGCPVSIDDFGTGFSSLQSLLQRQGTIRELKIDRTFVRDLTGAGPGQASVVQAIIHMAHGTDCRVVAEGVETADGVTLLRRMGCDVGQGYFFGRPRPLRDLSEWSAEWPGRWSAAVDPLRRR